MDELNLNNFLFLKQWNSPYINHFVSADAVIPSYTNPQDLNLYSYVWNNPLRYTDPTGHRACESYHGSDSCLSEKQVKKLIKNEQEAKKEKADQKKKHEIIKRTKEVVFGATLVVVGGVTVTAGSFVIYAAGAEAIAGVATGPGELLVAPHAVAVGTAGVGFWLVGATSIFNGAKLIIGALKH